MGSNLVALGANFIGDEYDSQIPEDIRAISDKRSNLNELRTQRNQMQVLQAKLDSGKLGPLDTAETQAQLQATQQRLEKLEGLGLTDLTPEEEARLTSRTGLKDQTWQDVLDMRDTYRNAANKIGGNKKKGQESLLGFENWGNRSGMRNADESRTNKEEVAAGYAEANRLLGEGDFGGFLSTGFDTFTEQAKDLGYSMLLNPSSITQTVAESAAHIAPITRLPAALSLGAEVIRKGSDQIREDEMRSSLTTGEQVGVGALAAAMAGTGYVQSRLEGAALTGKFLDGASKGIKSVTSSVTDKVKQASAATVAKVPYAGTPLDLALRGGLTAANTGVPLAARVGGAAAGEGITEGVQNIIEQNSGLQGRINLNELGESVTAGAVVGGAMAAPGAALRTGAQIYQGQQVKQQEKQVGNAQTTDAELLDPNNRAYNPTQYINRETLRAISTKDNITPEQMEASKVNVETGYTKAKNSYEKSIEAYDDAAGLADLEKLYEEKKVSYAEQLEGLKQKNPDYVERAENAFNASLASYERRIEDARKNQDKLEELKNRVKADKELYEGSTEAYKKFNEWYQSKAKKPEVTTEEEAKTVVETQEAAAPEVANKFATDERVTDSKRAIENGLAEGRTIDEVTEHVDSIFGSKKDDDAYSYAKDLVNKSFNAPEVVEKEATKLLGAPSFGDVKRMQALAENEALSEKLRKSLRVVSDALIAENKAKSGKEVNQNVLKGVDGYRGMDQYISEMQTAVQQNDRTQQKILTRQLSNFRSNLESKIAAFEVAQEAADGNNKKVNVVRKKDGTWFADVDRKIPAMNFSKNNGFIVHPRKADGTGGATRTYGDMQMNLEAVKATQLALDEISNSSRMSPQEALDSAIAKGSEEDFYAAIDALNEQERATGRDTTFRDSDPGVRTVDPLETRPTPPDIAPNTDGVWGAVENNEGDLIDNSSSNNGRVSDGNPFGNPDIEVEPDSIQVSDTGDFSSPQYDSESGSATSVPQSENQVDKAPRVQVGKDPNSFTNTNAQAYREVSDKRGLTSEIEDLAAQGLTARQIRDNLKADGKLDFLDITDQDSFVVGVRASLGIPSRADVDGQQEYEAWLKDYNQRKGTQPKEAFSDLDDDIQDEQVINSRKYPASKGWERTELAKSIKYVKDNGDGTETIVNTHKDTGEVIREATRNIAAKDLKNEIRKEQRNAQAKTYETKTEAIDTREVEHTGQEAEDLSEVEQEFITHIDVTDVDTKTLADGSIDESPAGALDALNTNGKSYKEAIEEEEKKPLDEQNLVKTGFVQRMKDGVNSPLVMFKDFYSYAVGRVANLAKGKKITSQHTGMLAAEIYNSVTGKNPTDFEVNVVTKLLATIGNDLGAVREMVKGRTPDRMKFAHESYIDWVMTDGKLEENVATAVIAASLDWVAQNATADPADVKTITKMLGLKDVKYLPHKVQNRLAHVGTYRQHVTEQLGKSIMASLQLKQLGHVDEARRDKLGQALGTVALTYMMQKGMVEMSTFKHRDLGAMKQAVLEYTNGKEDTRKNLFGNPDGTSDFIRATLQQNDNGEVTLSRMAAGVVRNFGNDVIKDIFSVQRTYKDVSLEPIEATPQTFNGFGSRLSKFQADVVAKQQATPYELDPGMSRILKAFWTTPERKGALIRMLGAQNPQNKLKIREKSVQSINQGIERSLNTIETTLNTTKGKPFYLPISVWSNMRMGIDSAFNPQGDKVHRAFSSLSAERAEIEIGDMSIFSGKANNSLTSYGNFLRALAFRMDGVKVPGVVNGKGLDKNNLDDFLPKLDAYIQSPEVEAAAKALGRIMNGKEEKGDVRQVTDLISEWGDGDVGQSALTLSALNAIREFTKAKNSKSGTFVTSVTPESDGTNNGPAFTHLLMNTLTPIMGKAFGIFRNNPNNTRNLAQYRTLENGKDMYEMLGEIKEIQWADADVHPELRAAFDGLDNKFAGRNGAKRDLIPFNYGAGYKAIVKANGREFLEGIYDTLESAILDGNEQKVKDTVAHINTILKFYNQNHKGKVPALDPKHFMTMNLELSEQVEMAIRSVDTAVRGPVIKAALKGLLSDYITARDEFNQAGNAAFNLYEPIYKSVATQFIQNIRETDNVRAAMDEGISKQERMELMKSIQKYMPTLQVAMGKESLNGKTSGIPLIDMARVWNDKRGVQVPFNQETKGINRSYKYMFSSISNSTFFEPGVSGLALFIQAHDAYVTARVMQALEAQNQHDSNSTNAHDIEIMAKIQNEAFLDATSISHIGQSFVRAALAPMKAYADGLVLPNHDLRVQVSTAMSALASAVGMDDGGTPITSREQIGQVLQNVIRHMYSKDLAKMDGLMDTYSINQYGTENGEYIVTPGKKNTLEKRKAELEKAMKQDLESVAELAKGLSKFLDAREDREIITNGTGSNKFDMNSVAAKEVAEVLKETKAEQPLSAFEQDLVKHQNKLKDPKRLVEFIQRKLGVYLKDSNPKVSQNAKMYNELLQLSLGSLKDLEVNILGKGEDTSKLLGIEEANAKNVHAWFKAEGDKKQINIRVGEGFKIDSKVLVHELIHASTAIALENLRNEKASGKVPPKHKEAMKSYDRLETLYNHVKDNGTMESYVEHYGISNLDEFIATGLTYPEFMKKLASMPAPAGQDYRLPRTGSIFRDMIDNLLGVFYGFFAPGKKYSAKELSAYEALVIDTAQFVQRTQDVPSLRSLPRVMQLQLLGAPQEQAHEQVSQMKSSEVFAILPESGDASFDAHLLGVMKSVTDRAFDKLPESYDGNEYSPEQIWNNALQSGEKPYVTEALRNGFGMSAREQFAVEAIEVAMEASIKDKSLEASYRELNVAFASAQKKLTVEHFLETDADLADVHDRALAQQKYDYLFDTSNPNYLSRFMAMAIGNKEVNKLLNTTVDRKALVPETDKVWFDKAVKFLNKSFDKLTDTHLGPAINNNTNTRLGLIAKKFVDIDHKNRNKVLEQIEDAISSTENFVNDSVIKAGHKISDLASSTDPESRIGKIVKNTTIQTFRGKPLKVFDVIQDWRNQENQNTTLGFLGELNREIANTTETAKRVEGLLRETKVHENNAQRLRTEIKKDVLSLFKDNGKNLSKEQREAITYGILRTDIQALSTAYAMVDVARFIQSHGARKSEIRRLEKGLSGNHLQRARDLARYMQTGKGNEILVKNAFGIAADAGLANPNMNPDPALVERIDHLVSLYALDYMNSDMRNELVTVVKGEMENGGIENLIKYHKGLVNDSKATLFKGDPLNVTKGYLPEVTNKYRDISVAYSAADADRLRSAMYIEVGPVTKSNADPSQFTPIMFYTEDAGKQQYISGTIALYNHGSKGKDVDMDQTEVAYAINLGRSYLGADPSYNPFESMDGMIPKYDTKGNITGYRYEMAAGTRDKYLERNNDFSDLIGTFTSLGYSKLANVDQNKKVVRALKNIYDSSNAWDRKKFVYVSYESTDPVAYAAWDRLSHETKEDVKKVWGKYGMWVSNETFLTVFGHPKESLFTRAFDKDAGFRNILEEQYVTMMKGLFGENSRVYAAKAERMWQEMVALTKNFIVIRNVSTLVMNVAANTFLLSAHGVPMGDLVKHTKDSILGGIQYRKDLALITKLEGRQRSGIGDPVQLQNEINIIRNRMQQNPMHEFIDAGMFAGIVEDIDPDSNMYSYQSSLQRKFEDKYEKIPKLLRRGVEYAFVTPSTPLYQFLHSSTQYSDFSAKYVLYKYYTEKAPKKLSHEEALQEASDNFINYDVPTSPWMQYANDMGLVMFTKYNLRIQKALFKLLAERPASALSQALIMDQFSSLPPGIDPIVFNNVGMPFRDGAFGFMDVWDEPFPIKLLQ